MLTGADLVDLSVDRCTYPVAPGRICAARSEWGARCTTCGHAGDPKQTVCGEHRFVLSGEVEFAADMAGIRCAGCGRPLRLIWEQL